MKLSSRTALVSLAILLLFVVTGSAKSQVKDSVLVIQSPGGAPYRCCYSFNVENRQRSGLRISEFRVRIVSGRGAFVPGQADSPPNWSVFIGQGLRTVSWLSNTTDAELDSAESVSGFFICASDTGVVRMVWETRNLDSVISSDTITVACRGIDCDEVFFTQLPSMTTCAYSVDLVAGNRASTPINDLHFHPVTPGATFISSPTGQPPLWTRFVNRSDTIAFRTFGPPVTPGNFLEGFLLGVDPGGNGSVRIEWWTTNFGTVVCRDTITIQCVAPTRLDSARIRRSLDSCCHDLTIRNTHEPQSAIGRVALTVLTPGVRFSATPGAPSGWSRVVASQDSISYSATTQLQTGDSIRLAGLCFDNASASTDTISYRWETFARGIPVTVATQSLVCIRPLTECDSVSLRVDSSVTDRKCLTVAVTNRNSRGSSIDRIAFWVSNPGGARRILTSSAPPGWTASSTGPDSVAFTGGLLRPGQTAQFQLCLGLGDTTTRDPVTLRWATESMGFPLCSDSIVFNAIIVRLCDSLGVVERQSGDPDLCCFDLRIFNRNSQGRVIDGLLLETLDGRVAFSEGNAESPWQVTNPSFPDPRLGFSGGSLGSGDSSRTFRFCLDIRQIPELPVTLPVLWKTFSEGQLLCSDTLRLFCSDQIPAACDSFRLTDRRPGAGGICTYDFSVINIHTPASNIRQIRFVIAGGNGQFLGGSTSGAASSWQAVRVSSDTLLFVGDSIVPPDSVGTFSLQVDSETGEVVRVEMCTMTMDQPLCCQFRDLHCTTGSVETARRRKLGSWLSFEPQPVSATALIRFSLSRASQVVVIVRGIGGELVDRFVLGNRPAGDQRFAIPVGDLPSGVYVVTVSAGEEEVSGRMVVVR